MHQPNFPARRYDEREVRQLLERAAQLQGPGSGTGPQSGLTLQELEAIALEAGLDPAALRRAAAELDTPGATTAAGLGARLAGGPLRTTLEHSLPGSGTPDAFAELIPIVQRFADLPGHVGQVGSTLNWSSHGPNNLRQLQVAISARNGQIQIWIEERYTGLAGGVFGGGLGGIGGGVGGGLGAALGGALGSATLGVGIPVLVVGVTYAACRWIYGSYVDRRRAALEQLLRELAAALGARALPTH